jgi:hypothetical protein
MISEQARIVHELMADGMRLIVPIGDIGIKLVPDPRYDHLAGAPSQSIPTDVALELIRGGFAGEQPIESQPGHGGFIGVKEMFSGHEDLVPDGAKVFCYRRPKVKN